MSIGSKGNLKEQLKESWKVAIQSANIAEDVKEPIEIIQKMNKLNEIAGQLLPSFRDFLNDVNMNMSKWVSALPFLKEYANNFMRQE